MWPWERSCRTGLLGPRCRWTHQVHRRSSVHEASTWCRKMLSFWFSFFLNQEKQTTKAKQVKLPAPSEDGRGTPDCCPHPGEHDSSCGPFGIKLDVSKRLAHDDPSLPGDDGQRPESSDTCVRTWNAHRWPTHAAFYFKHTPSAYHKRRQCNPQRCTLDVPE